MLTLWTESQTKHMEIHREHLRGNPAQSSFQVEVMGWPEHRATYDGTTSSWKDDSGPISESECDPVCFPPFSTVFPKVLRKRNFLPILSLLPWVSNEVTLQRLMG